MYLSHFSLKERPFSISPDPRFLFMSNRYREALAHLTYGVEDGGGFVLLTGEVGTGKTTVCRCLLQQLPENTRLAFVLNPKLNSLELLATICDELGIEYPESCDSLKTLTDKLSEYLLKCYEEGLSVVVMIDEAQNIEPEVLEQIRLLTNLETNQKKLLQIILVGQPELQEKLAQRELRQLAQRITARYHLRPLNLKETMAYVLHRIRIAGSRKSLFSRKSIEILHTETAGVPRLINTICDRALVAASSRNKNQVEHKIMRDAIHDVLGTGGHPDALKTPRSNKWLFWVGGMIILVVFAFAAYWLGQQAGKSAQQQFQKSNNQSEKVSEITAENEQSKLPSTDSSNQQAIESVSLLDRMLANERWDNNGNWSMQKLMALWSIDYSPLVNGLGCDYAASYGLVCKSIQGNWQQLREYNRPANLKFSAGLQGEFWGTISQLSGSDATLHFGERTVTLPLDELSTIWTGDFQFLWQAPQGYQGDIRIGDQGESVLWLTEKMNQLVDSNISIQSNFDQNLLTSVSRYQQQRGIAADGIVGMHTILTINGETLDGIPLLQPVSE